MYFQPMVYDGFRKFMDSYMEAEIPEELCKHLFLSLMKKPIGPPTTTGKDYHHVRDVAAVTATQTVCAPITHLGADIHIDKGEKHQGFVEKIHGLTEKLQGLGLHGEKGHSRHDSGESGKRSRAGTPLMAACVLLYQLYVSAEWNLFFCFFTNLNVNLAVICMSCFCSQF